MSGLEKVRLKFLTLQKMEGVQRERRKEGILDLEKHALAR